MCQELADPDDGQVMIQNGNLFPGSLAIYTCDDGYISTDELVQECTCTGWNATEPTCMGEPLCGVMV